MMGMQRENERTAGLGRPAFGELEPYAGKLARTVLRGARGRQRPLAYSTDVASTLARLISIEFSTKR